MTLFKLGKTRVVADAGEAERTVAAATLSTAAVRAKAADAGETEWMAAAAVASTAALKLYFLIRRYQLGRVVGGKLYRISTVHQIPHVPPLFR